MLKTATIILTTAFMLVGCVTAPTTLPSAAPVATTTPEALPKPESAEVPILIYHHIRPIAETDSASDQTFIVSPETLDRQLAYLAENGFSAISFADVVAHFDGTLTLPEKPIIISFDDGLSNQYDNAWPLLKKHNLTATFFIFVNPIGKSKNYLTWEQLTELKNAGMEIGGHGYYHLYLNKISAAELDKELVAAKRLLEERLGGTIAVMAYPFGAYNPAVTEAVKAAGYRAARDIVNGRTHSDLFKLRGYFVTEDMARFKAIVD